MKLSIIKTITLIVAVAILATIGGVSATWYYSTGTVEAVEEDVKLTVFPWEGSEQLPDDVAGEDHMHLIEEILNGTYTDENGNTTAIGLNNPNSYLNQEIDRRSSNWLMSSDVLGSMDFWEREDINKYFDTSTNNLTFVIYFPEGVDDTYYLYTTSIVLGGQNAPNIPVNEIIYPVYRTILQKNAEGIFEATKTECDYARSAYYSNPITGSIFVKYPSFNPSSWQAGNRGEDFDTAIYTYNGQTQTAYFDGANARYYGIELSAQTVLSVSTASTTAKIAIYNENKKLANLRTGEQNTNEMTFVANAGKQYYIVVKDSSPVTFTVSTAQTA